MRVLLSIREKYCVNKRDSLLIRRGELIKDFLLHMLSAGAEHCLYMGSKICQIGGCAKVVGGGYVFTFRVRGVDLFLVKILIFH